VRLIDELAEAAKRVGLEVRREKILREVGYRARGGACRLREQDPLILDREQAPADQIEVLAEAPAAAILSRFICRRPPGECCRPDPNRVTVSATTSRAYSLNYDGTSARGALCRGQKGQPAGRLCHDLPHAQAAEGMQPAVRAAFR
jgi:hypothetical protein